MCETILEQDRDTFMHTKYTSSGMSERVKSIEFLDLKKKKNNNKKFNVKVIGESHSKFNGVL